MASGRDLRWEGCSPGGSMRSIVPSMPATAVTAVASVIRGEVTELEPGLAPYQGPSVMELTPEPHADAQYISSASVESSWVFQVWIVVPGVVDGPRMVRHSSPDMMRPPTKCHS